MDPLFHVLSRVFWHTLFHVLVRARVFWHTLFHVLVRARVLSCSPFGAGERSSGRGASSCPEPSRWAPDGGSRRSRRPGKAGGWASLAVLLALMGGGTSSAEAATCSAIVSPMNFSALGFLATSVDTSSTIVVTCQRSLLDLLNVIQVCPLIGPSTGGGTGGNRTLTSTMGNPSLRYGLYSNAARATTWGDFNSMPYPTFSLDLSAGTPVSQTLTVYGRVFAPQTPYGSDVYRDAPTVSLAYAPIACGLGLQASVGPLNVVANALPSCTLSVAPLNFGSMGLLRAPVNGASSVQTTCTKGTAYTVTFGAGQGAGATPQQRFMTSGANTLAYNLYVDSARTTVWSDTQGVHGTGTGVAVSLPVYASIPAQSSPPPGVYQDQVVVTISY